MIPVGPSFARLPAARRIVAAAIGGALLVVGLTTWHVWEDQTETIGRAEERVVSFATVTEAYVRRRLREAESGMKIIAEMRSGELAGPDAIREIAELHRRNFPFIEALGVVEEGRTDLMAGDAGTAKALTAWALAQSGADDRLRVGALIQRGAGSVPVIPRWLRFAARADRKASVVVAAIRSDVLSLMHAALRLESDKVSVLVNGSGIIMAREPYLSGAIGADISKSDAFVDVPVDSKSAVKRFPSSVDGRTYLLGMSRLSDLGLTVRAGERWDDILVSWRDRTERGAVIALILLLITGWLARLGWVRAIAEERERQQRFAADARYRDAMATLEEGVVTHGPDAAVQTYNAAALRILGVSDDQLRGLTSMDPRWRSRREDGSDFPGAEHPVMRVLATGEAQRDVLMEIEAGDGIRRWIEINAIPNFSAGMLSGAVVSFTDVTARRATLAQMEALNHTLEARVAERTAQLQQLGGELADVEDRERRQISRDLHDDIAQTLAVARIRLAGLSGETGEEVRRVARTVGELIDQADASIRSLAARLAPPALAEIGLVAGLEWLADEMERNYGLEVTVDDDGASKPLTEAVRTTLFRAVRELLINVSKHAGVSRASVECRRKGDAIVVEVADSGRGFDPQSATENSARGLGLRSVYERLRYIGGSITWAAHSGAGSRAVVMAPLAQVASTAMESTS